MIGRLRRARRVEVAELEITAFMNLMVVLVPFLLITAVFTQLAVKQLNLPDNSEAQPPDEEQRSLTLTLREDGVSVQDPRGAVQQWPRDAEGGYAFDAVNNALTRIKAVDPDNDNIVLLVEPGIPYQIVIEAMDAVQYRPAREGGVLVDLYPRISMGETAPLEAAP